MQRLARASLSAAKRVTVPVRTFAAHAAPAATHAHAHAAPAAHSHGSDVVVPEIVDTLEWVLDSPPNIHQFDEPPIVVEIEHLDALIVKEH